MAKKLTITVDERVYEGLHNVGCQKGDVKKVSGTVYWFERVDLVSFGDGKTKAEFKATRAAAPTAMQSVRSERSSGSAWRVPSVPKAVRIIKTVPDTNGTVVSLK